jgi:phosphatidylinositol alpha-1,6-mannosyltransferase
MVAIEAASFGLPTIAFATGGVVDAVKNNISGNLVEPESYQDLSKQIINSLNSSFNKNAAIEYANQFSWESFGQQIHTVLNKESE